MQEPGDEEDLVIDHQVPIGRLALADQEAAHAVALHRAAGLAGHLAERRQGGDLGLGADQILGRHRSGCLSVVAHGADPRRRGDPL